MHIESANGGGHTLVYSSFCLCTFFIGQYHRRTAETHQSFSYRVSKLLRSTRLDSTSCQVGIHVDVGTAKQRFLREACNSRQVAQTCRQLIHCLRTATVRTSDQLIGLITKKSCQKGSNSSMQFWCSMVSYHYIPQPTFHTPLRSAG